MGAHRRCRIESWSRDAVDEHERALDAALLNLRSALGGATYLLQGTFTYADIVAATLLQGIAPVADEYMRLLPATRRVWTRPALVERFDDLVRWRDGLYGIHRRRSTPRR